MKWKLHDTSWNIVAEIELPDDAPDVVIFEGRIFFYDERVERYVTPTVHVVTSSACTSEEPRIADARPLFAGEAVP
jgi:uridine kinase